MLRSLARACCQAHGQYLRTFAAASTCQTPALPPSDFSSDHSAVGCARNHVHCEDNAVDVRHLREGAGVRTALDWDLAAVEVSPLGGGPSNAKASALQEESSSSLVSSTAGLAINSIGSGIGRTLSLLNISTPARRRWPDLADFGIGAARGFSGAADGKDGDGKAAETIQVTFVNKEGEEKVIRVPVGTSMLEAAHENDIELEGACEGSLACSTCHVIVMDEKDYKRLPEPSDEENDMLDLAFGLTETSRLGCQIVAKLELDGLRLAVPGGTSDARQK